MTDQLIRPRINLNGSPPSDLIAPRMKAVTAIEEAIKCLRLATPNGRDYPGKEDQCEADRELHYARLRLLSEIGDTLLAEAIEIKIQTKRSK